MNKKLILTILSVASLAIGAVIYLMFRIQTLIIFEWIELLQLSDTVEILRDKSAPLYDKLPAWIIYSLPNGLWIYSLIISMKIIWDDHKKAFFIYCLSIIAIALLIELGQAIDIIIGTFDLYDILHILIFGGLGLITTEILQNE